MKIEKYDLTFDSELELMFYEYLKEKELKFYYQSEFKKIPININLGRRKTYTPDFIIKTRDSIYIIETKGYAKWSANEDNNICDFMKNKVLYDVSFLTDWLSEVFTHLGICDEEKENLLKLDVKYERIKHLKGIGFVPYDYKNPNTISNKRKEKIIVLENDLKETKELNKKLIRAIKYLLKEKEGKKPAKKEKELIEELKNIYNIK